MKFKVGDKVVINTTKFDDQVSVEFGKLGKITNITKKEIWVEFPANTWIGGNGEPFLGSYREEDLRHLNPLEKLL